jgi:hypothetical protein
LRIPEMHRMRNRISQASQLSCSELQGEAK